MKAIQKYILMSVLLICGLGCREFVELEPPQNLLVTDNVFINDETAIAATTAMYANIVQKLFSRSLSLNTGLASDELKNYASTEVSIQTYTNNLRAISVGNLGLWDNLYNFIYQSNAIIEGVSASSTLTPSVKKQLLGEAHLVRAWCHFYLLNLWGDVPLITSTDYEINRLKGRTAGVDVYAKIIEDLNYAKENLNSGYVSLNSITLGTERIRPNSYTASALLARVYLYTKDYTNAAKEATEVIDNKVTYEIVGINQTFKKNNKEAIWQIMKPLPINNMNTPEGQYYILTSAPTTVAISSHLYSAFESSDLRRANWIGKITVSGVDYFFPYKYQVRQSAELTEYTTLIRLAELYLIRAEARAMNSTNLSDAIDDLDVIRTRAGIPLIKATNPNISKESFLALILSERQKELFTEYGHRWLDLKRTGTINQVMSAVVIDKGSTWDESKQLWPIPIQSMETAPNLKPQNPGYQ